MLELWLCPDRKQNTTRMLTQICDNAEKGMGEQILVVPEQFSHTAERMLCELGGDTISRYAEVLGFSRLAGRVFSLEGGAAETETDAGGRLLMMAMAVEQVRSRLKIYGTGVSKPEFLLQLLHTFDEFDSFCVTPEALRQAAQKLSGGLAVKMEELSLLMESYAAVCANSGQNPQSRLTRLLEALETGNFARGKVFYFDGFADFNGVEREIIAQLLNSGARVSVNLTCDGLDSSCQAFETAGETARQLLSLANAQGIAPKIHCIPVEEGNNPLHYLTQHLFRSGMKPYGQPQMAVRQLIAQDVSQECRAVAGEILRLVRDGVRWRDISVVCVQEETYRPVLESVFRRAGIPAYYAGNTDILSEPVAYFALSALDAACNGMEQETMFAYLKSGFSPIERDRCDALENYALLWSISGSKWGKSWTMNPYGIQREADEQSEHILRQLNEDRIRAISPLLRLKEKLQTAATTGDMVLTLNGFLEEIGLNERLNDMAQELYQQGDLQRAQEYAQVYGILCTVLEQMYGVLGKSVRSPEEFYRIFRVALSCYDIGTIPAKLDCVTVGDPMSQRQSDVKILFILGANEGAFPGTRESRGLLTDHERVCLMDLGLGVSPTAAGRLDREFACIHSVVSAPREKVFFSALEGREAYLFRAVGELFPDALIPTDLTAFVRYALREYVTYLAARPERMEKLSAQDEPLVEKAWEIAQGREYKIGQLSKETVRSLYGKTLRLSSSKVDMLASCRFAYFLNYGLQAKERKSVTMDAPLYGTFVHNVLEHTVRQVQQEGGFKTVPVDRVLQIAQERMEQYAREELADLWDSERAVYLFRRTFEEVRQVVRELYDELSCSDFVPQWFELEFSAQGQLPAVKIAGRQMNAELIGYVDRVDVVQLKGKTYVRVVDYKTGKKDFDYTNVLHGLGLQMLLYLFALAQSGDKLLQRPLIPCGVLYFPARIEKIRVRDRFSEEEAQNLRRKSLKRKGLLLDDEQILQAMEPCQAEPRYLPYSLDKEGTRKGDLATKEQLRLLEEHVFRTVVALGDDLYQGNVAPNPYFRENDQNACAWCPYSEVCGNTAQVRWLKKVDSQEDFWNALEEKYHD